MSSSEFAVSPEGQNVYNRRPNAKPVVRIGNWVEERAIWEELERRKLNNIEEETANLCIVDPTVDPKDYYTTSNSAYGKFSKRKEGQTVAREPQLSIIKEQFVDPRKARKNFETENTGVRGGHDILNTDLLLAAHKDYSLETTKYLQERWVYDYYYEDKAAYYEQKEPVTFWNEGNDSISFKRSSRFTRPIEEQ